MTTKVHPPATASSPITVYGRTYNPAGGVQDVPDSDAQMLIANGWINAAAGSNSATTGADSTKRPVNPPARSVYIDNALGIKEIFDGKYWRNSITGVVVP